MASSRLPPPPQVIYDHLNGHIVGHYVMKKALSVAVYNHYCDTMLNLRAMTSSKLQEAESESEEQKEETVDVRWRPRHGDSGYEHVQVVDTDDDEEELNTNACAKKVLARTKSLYNPKINEKSGQKLRPVASNAKMATKSLDRPVRDSLASMPDLESHEYLTPVVARVITEASTHRVRLVRGNALAFDATGPSRPLHAIAETIARFLHVPYLRIDCLDLVATSRLAAQSELQMPRRGWLGQLYEGYQKETLQSSLNRLQRLAKFDMKAVERSIVFVDNMHKMGDGDAGRELLEELVDLIEGKTKLEFSLPSGGQESSKSEDNSKVEIEASNIFFLCFGTVDLGGKLTNKRVSLDSLEEGYASHREDHVGSQMSYSYSECSSISTETTSSSSGSDDSDDSFQGLRYSKLAHVLLTAKHGPIPECKNLWGLRDVDLRVTPEAMEVIVNQALEQNAGTEGVRTILEKLLLTVIFEIAPTSVRAVEITEDTVLGKLPPIVHHRSSGTKKKSTINPSKKFESSLTEVDCFIQEELEL